MTSMYLLTMSYTGKGSGGGLAVSRLHENMSDLAASYTDRSKEDLASVECIRVTNTLPDAVLTCKHKPGAICSIDTNKAHNGNIPRQGQKLLLGQRKRQSHLNVPERVRLSEANFPHNTHKALELSYR